MHGIRIYRLIVPHLVCPDDLVIRSLVKPCSPEAECGIGADIASAVAHEHEILYAVFAVIPFNDGIS